MRNPIDTINWPLRPAKRIQRKMLCDAFARLRSFGRLTDFQYVGFGARHFSDFVLVHKRLDIRAMVSIERASQQRERFEFNKPFACIKVLYGDSTAKLPTLRWDRPSIVWLDYERKVGRQVLGDLELVLGNVPGGSIVVVTVNADVASAGNLRRQMDSLRRRVGEQRMPLGIRAKQLRGWGLARVSRDLIHNEIGAVIADRNGLRVGKPRLYYAQLFNFHYADGPRMLTVGGIIYAEDQLDAFKTCGFDQLDFVRTDKDSFHIQVPSFTHKECRFLEEHLPSESPADIAIPWLSPEELKAYAKCYRYFPAFAEADLY